MKQCTLAQRHVLGQQSTIGDLESNWTSISGAHPPPPPPPSAVRLHTEEMHDAPVRSEDFTILDSFNNPASLRILESLYIYKMKPKLNETNSAFPLNMVD